jgi:hypothetical protein
VSDDNAPPDRYTGGANPRRVKRMKPDMLVFLRNLRDWHNEHGRDEWALPHEIKQSFTGAGNNGILLRGFVLRGYVERKQRPTLFGREKPTYHYRITQAGLDALKREHAD